MSRTPCQYCPHGNEQACWGDHAPGVCKLIDPTHHGYDQKYLKAIINGPSEASPANPSAHEYPSLKAQAMSLFRSARKFARSGFRLAPKAIRRDRLATCLGCDKYDSAQKRCRVCGCKNSAKVWLASDACPLGKWAAIAGAPSPAPSSDQAAQS